MSEEVHASLDSELYRLDSLRPTSAICNKLGVTPSSSFIELYSYYQGIFDSDHCSFLLLDLDSDRESIVTQTMMMREVHHLPERFLSLSDYQTNGLIVYDTATDFVYWMDFEGGMDMMINGTLEPYFESFNDFANWYFCGLGEPYPLYNKISNTFQGKSEAPASPEHGNTPNIQHYREYIEFRDKGLKKQASKAVRAFINSFKTSEQITNWVWKNLPIMEKNCHSRLRHELFSELVYPVLKAGYLSNDLQSTLWLGKLIQNLTQSESLWRKLNWINEIDLYKKCLEIDPDHYESRRCLILALLNWLHHTEHHWPSGILYGMNGATLSQCEEIREEVELLFQLDLEQQHTTYLSEYLEKLETYRARLLNRENSE